MTNANLLPKPVRPTEGQPETPQQESVAAKFRRYCEENPGSLECRIDDN